MQVIQWLNAKIKWLNAKTNITGTSEYRTWLIPTSVKKFQRAIEECPLDVGLRVGLGARLMFSGQYENALIHLQLGLSLLSNPDEAIPKNDYVFKETY